MTYCPITVAFLSLQAVEHNNPMRILFSDSIYDFQVASYDRSYLESVKKGFGSLGVDLDTLMYLGIVVLAAIALYLAGKAYNSLKSRLRRGDFPAYWIVRRPEIQCILQQALDQRSKFEIKFLPSDYARPIATCSLEKINQHALQFDIGPEVSVSKRWLNRTVEFYFRIQGGKRQHVYYRFTSPVVGVKRLGDRGSLFLVEPPPKIELQQKRAFLRLEPPSQYLLGCAVWQESERQRPEQLKTWGRPILVYNPDELSNPINVEDISAGGMRLLVTRQIMKKLKLKFTMAQRLYVMLDLYDPDSSRKRRFWLQCRVQHVYEDFETRNAEYGLQFMAYGQLRKKDGEPTQQVEWKQTGQEGIELLGSWVMKRHLELYRDKGIV